jgi:hypothetical protein
MLLRIRTLAFTSLVVGCLFATPAAGGDWTPVKEGELAMTGVSFCHPTPRFPYRHLSVSLAFSGPRTPGDDKIREIQIRTVAVDGQDVEDFQLYFEKEVNWVKEWPKPIIAIPCDWRAKRTYRLEMTLQSKLAGSFAAPDAPTFPDMGWAHSKVLVLRETAGIPRTREPVFLDLDRLGFQDAKAASLELRVVEVGPAGRELTEIPSQVYAMTPREGRPSLHAVCFVSISAGEEKAFVLYWGNPRAEKPSYTADLSVAGEGLGLTIENEHYKAKLAAGSGQLASLVFKQGSKQEWTFAHGPVHWNPDARTVDPRSWFSTRDWKAPEMTSLWEAGSLLGRLVRRGFLAGEGERIHFEVTYTFLAGTPYFLLDSTISVMKDVELYCLRNDEMAFREKLFTDAAWRTRAGGVRSLSLAAREVDDARVAVLDNNDPWVSFFNRTNGDGVASIRLLYRNSRAGGERATLCDPHTAILSHGEGIYWTRGLVAGYSRPFLVTRVRAGSTYQERNAYVFYRWQEATGTDPLDRYSQTLHAPLEKHWVGEEGHATPSSK